MQPKHIVIVGGVAGGASAAARLRRLDEQANIILVERGEDISFANCGMPYHIGGIIPDEADLLVTTARRMAQRFRIDVRTKSQVVSIDRTSQQVKVQPMEGEAYDLAYDALILSPGALPLIPRVTGIDLPGVMVLRSLGDMRAIRDAVVPGGEAVVVGGGFIGVEVAENLRYRGMNVLLVEASDQILPPMDGEMARIAQGALENNGVRLKLGASLTGILKEGQGLKVTLEGETVVTANLVVIAIGVMPESDIAVEAGLKTGIKNSIAVDEDQRTSDPAIWAVGDAAQTWDSVLGQPAHVPLAGPANRQGRLVAENVAGIPRAFGGVIGTAVVKLFDLTAASVGANEKRLKQLDMPYEKVYLFPTDHAQYYPGAQPMALKLLFGLDGRVLGAQCIGAAGVDKRIDVIATAIKLKATVQDLAELELCYAPPYGSAKDPVNVAGMVACDVLAGLQPLVHWHDLQGREDQVVLLDVRTQPEHDHHRLPDSLHIPLDQLRERLDEVPKGRPIWVFCEQGLRGYVAQRILMGNGFQQVRNLSGGMRLLRMMGPAFKPST